MKQHCKSVKIAIIKAKVATEAAIDIISNDEKYDSHIVSLVAGQLTAAKNTLLAAEKTLNSRV
jgi:hypothetical protein